MFIDYQNKLSEKRSNPNQIKPPPCLQDSSSSSSYTCTGFLMELSIHSTISPDHISSSICRNAAHASSYAFLHSGVSGLVLFPWRRYYWLQLFHGEHLWPGLSRQQMGGPGCHWLLPLSWADGAAQLPVSRANKLKVVFITGVSSSHTADYNPTKPMMFLQFHL